MDSSIHVELLAPRFQFGQPEPNRAAHHSVMGDLLSLNISIHERRAYAEELGCSLHVDWSVIFNLGFSMHWRPSISDVPIHTDVRDGGDLPA
jgi:hypothetical protein